MSPVGSTFGLNLSHSFVNHIRFVIFEVFVGRRLLGSFTHNTIGIYSPMENMNMLNVSAAMCLVLARLLLELPQLFATSKVRSGLS